VDIGEKVCRFLQIIFPAAWLERLVRIGLSMASRPGDIAERMSHRGKRVDRILRATFRLPVEAARLKAPEIQSQTPQDGYMAVVEQWRQLPDGQIEFTMRRLRAAD
jgi:hypothetical protein